MFDYDVIPRSKATKESPGTACESATFYQEIATGLRPRNDSGNLEPVLLFLPDNHRILVPAYSFGGIVNEMQTLWF